MRRRSSVHSCDSRGLLFLLALCLSCTSSPAFIHMVKIPGLAALRTPALRQRAATLAGSCRQHGARAPATAQGSGLTSASAFQQLPGRTPKSAGFSARLLQTKMQAAATAATAPAQARNEDPGAVAVIVGGSRGIGLAMVSDLITRFKGHIFATGRSPDASQELQELSAQHPGRVTPIAMDVTNEQSIISAAALIRDRSGGRVDLLVNTAGILHDASEPSCEGRMPERQLKDITEEWLLYNFKVNTMGPVLVAKHFQEMLQTKGPRADKGAARPLSVLATLSARVGSIEGMSSIHAFLPSCSLLVC